MRRHSWQPLVLKALSVDLMVTTAAPDALSFARIELRLLPCGVSGRSPACRTAGSKTRERSWSYVAEFRLCGELLRRPYQLPARLARSRAQLAPVRQPYQWRLGAGFPPSDVLQLTDDRLAARHPPHGRTQRWRVDAPTNLLLRE
jgi:hypothetical protein